MEDIESELGADPGLPPNRLTLSRLIQERPFAAAGIATGGCDMNATIAWCLPWDQAIRTDEGLDEIAVYGRADQMDPASSRLPLALRDLARRGAAALLVAGAVTEATAERLSAAPLPAIFLHSDVSYRRISRLVAELTLARETHVLQYGLTVHRTLAELLHVGAGLVAMCAQLSRLSHCAVAIFDPQWHLLAFEQAEGRVLDPPAVARTLRESAPDLVPETVKPGAGPYLGKVSFDGSSVTCVINPIVLGGRHDGWVVVIESAEPPSQHDLAEHRIVLEHAAMIVGSEMLRMRSVEQAEERARGDFVHALLHGRFTAPHDLAARAAHYGFPVEATYGVVVASGLSAGVAAESAATVLFQLAREATRLLARPRLQTLATVVGDVLAVIRQVDAPSRNAANAGSRPLAEYATALEHDLARRVGHQVYVTYGRPVGSAARILQSYREARIALSLRQRLLIGYACGFGDLRVYATLADLAASAQGQAFATDLLAPLRAHRAGENLEHAVIAYVESGGNVNEASRRLHIHRNTMLYKLDRASRALQLDMRQPEHQFSVWLAHKIDLLAAAAEQVDRDLNPH